MQNFKVPIKYFGFLFVWFSINILISGCSKEGVCQNSKKAEFVNLTGLDGCGFVIKLNNGDQLEPVNLSEFNIKPHDGMKIWVEYHEVAAGSICMVAPTVEIHCLKER